MSAESKLYGGGAQPLPGGPKQANAEADPVADALYAQKSEPRFEVEQGTPAADVLYGSSPEVERAAYEPALRDSLDALAEFGGLDAEGRQQIAEDAAELFADARLAPAEATKVYALMAHRAKAGPVSDDVLADWTRRSRDRLNQRYGTAASARLAAIQQFVSNRPELAAFLRESGLGSHPDLVMALAENAADVRMERRTRART